MALQETHQHPRGLFTYNFVEREGNFLVYEAVYGHDQVSHYVVVHQDKEFFPFSSSRTGPTFWGAVNQARHRTKKNK
jgi:hypothetical protein